MSYEVYKVLHLAGVILLFTSLGGLTLHAMNGGTKASNASRKLAGAMHGVALLLLLVAGFGLVARLGHGLGLWVYLKLGLWLALGGVTAAIYKKPEWSRALWFLIPGLGVAAAAVAIYKPGM